jgi:hypothetical protein
MSRFNETKVDSTSGTVEIGAGLTWDKVYVALESTGVNVVGGRNPGLGVSGLTLGGGGCICFHRGLSISDLALQAIHTSQVSMDLRSTPLLDMNLCFQTELSLM